MRVKIVKASNPEYWYSDRVGEVFEIDGVTRDGKSYTIKGERLRVLFIEDCIVVESPVELTLIAPGSRGKVGEVDILIAQVHIESRQVEYTITWWNDGQRYSERVPEYEITEADKTMKVGFQ